MGTDRIIYFRTDGNRHIATGHLVRCLAIAQALSSLGCQVCFLVSDKESRSLLQSFDQNHQFPVQILEHASYQHLEWELPELLPILSAHPDTVLFLDSYYVTEHYMQAVRDCVRLVYLDDLQLFNYPVDLLINYDVLPAAQLAEYRQFYSQAKKTLLGETYTPLRRQFSKKKMPFRPSADHLLITTGGSDPYHFGLQIISKFQEMNHPGFHGEFHLIIGSMNQDKELLYKLADDLPFLILHENVKDMASLMEQCDFAVSAAGTTLYELCSIGVPTISYSMADNQISAATAFDQAGVISYAGDIREDAEKVLEHITIFIRQMVSDQEKRKAVHENMNHFVDGNGARRIATEILSL